MEFLKWNKVSSLVKMPFMYPYGGLRGNKKAFMILIGGNMTRSWHSRYVPWYSTCNLVTHYIFQKCLIYQMTHPRTWPLQLWSRLLRMAVNMKYLIFNLYWLTSSSSVGNVIQEDTAALFAKVKLFLVIDIQTLGLRHVLSSSRPTLSSLCFVIFVSMSFVRMMNCCLKLRFVFHNTPAFLFGPEKNKHVQDN